MNKEKPMFKGEIVIVRDSSGKPLLRKIWEVRGDLIDVINDEQFKLMEENDHRAIGPVGFPKEDVFCYDPQIVNLMAMKQSIAWEKLAAFRC